MTTYIPERLRGLVITRARYLCEYCRLHQRDSLYPHEVDHIIPEKHRGTTTADNLCLACLECNRHKGTDFASFDLETGAVAVLYHPRLDRWKDHFRLNGAVIEPLSATGRVTVFVLKLNDPLRLRPRTAFMRVGRYPAPEDTE